MSGKYNRQCPLLGDMEVALMTEEHYDRPLIEALLDDDETYELGDQQVVTTDEIEVINAWAKCAPCIKYTATPQRRRKHAGKTQDDNGINYNNHDRDKRDSKLSYRFHWRKCVEPNTYRYLYNNGMYRDAKSWKKTTEVDIPKYVYLHHQKRAAIQNERLTAEQKHKQREIKKELRKELEIEKLQERLEEERKRQQERETVKDETEQDFDVDKLSVVAHADTVSEISIHLGKSNENKIVSRNLEGIEIVAKKYAKHGENGVKQETPRKKMTFLDRVRTPVELPPIDVPLFGKNTAASAANENNGNAIPEELHHRITVLDNEIKKDFYILRKSHDDHLLGTYRSHSEPPARVAHSLIEYSKSSPYTDLIVDDSLNVKQIIKKKKRQHSKSTGEHFSDYHGKVKHKTTAGDGVNVSKNNASAPPGFGNAQNTDNKRPSYSRGTDRSSRKSVTPHDKKKPNTPQIKQLEGSMNPVISRESSMIGGYLRGDSTLGMYSRESSTLGSEPLPQSDRASPSVKKQEKKATTQQGRKVISKGNIEVSAGSAIQGVTGKLMTAEHLHLVRTGKAQLKTEESIADGLLPGIAGKRLHVVITSQRLGLN